MAKTKRSPEKMECRKPPGRPKDLKKQAAILKSAMQHFMRHGFDRASMDAIAEDAGVSKLTIYSHFGSKEALFTAIVLSKCNEVKQATEGAAMARLEPKEALTYIGRRFLDMIFQKDVIAMQRLLIAESATRPKIGRLLYEAGPMPTKKMFAQYLREMTKQGKLNVADPDRATNHFFTMLKGEQLDMMLFNLRGGMAKKEKETHLKDCVGVFLRAYTI